MRVSTREADVLSGCLEYLRVKQLLAWRANNGGVFDPSRKCYRSFRGLKGVADILGVLGNGRFLAVECKSATGRLSEAQRHFLDQVSQRGGIALCVRSVRDLDEQLAPILAQTAQAGAGEAQTAAGDC
ncbi:MAG TPA: VRR-NUC domain-containing protein [Gemmataceae bacterium]|nr:VRR-NUC domain-containing protein [Gemmataceae bacterium]